MFSMPIAQEEALLGALRARIHALPDHSCEVDDGTALPCPCCGEGRVRTYCEVTHDGSGRPLRHCTHRCDSCGKEIRLASLQADILLRSPFEPLARLDTPFGTFTCTTQDGRLVPFRHRASVRDPEGKYGPVQVHELDVDIVGCKVGDVVSCDLSDLRITFWDSDERAEFRGGVNDLYAVEVSGYDPEFWLYRDSECYEGTGIGEELEGGRARRRTPLRTACVACKES